VSAGPGFLSAETVALATEAMATRFELILPGDDVVRLRAAGEEALREIERAEALLSRFRATSPIARVNAAAGGPPVRVDPRVLRLLERAREISVLTEGAFDPTVGPLLRAWGFADGGGHPPEAGAVDRARRLVGMDRVEVDKERSTVRLPQAGMELDLGSIGKGWAIDAAIGALLEQGVASGFLHGGTSSVHVLGRRGGSGCWRVGWRVPGEPEPRVVELAAAFSVSAPHGKAFEVDGRSFGHVLDPRSGAPTSGAASAAVRGPSSALCDALSTALLVLGESGRDALAERFPGHLFDVAPTRPAAHSHRPIGEPQPFDGTRCYLSHSTGPAKAPEEPPCTRSTSGTT
jgi:FAD:protein FMN transferase